MIMVEFLPKVSAGVYEKKYVSLYYLRRTNGNESLSHGRVLTHLLP